MLIAHDPGHGTPRDSGPSPGTHHHGLLERDWVLQMATDIRESIPWAAHMMLRTAAAGVRYGVRAERALQSGAELVICHHVNAHADPEIDGLMCFAIHGDHLGREVGDAICRAAPAELRRRKARTTTAAPDDWTSRAHWVLRHYVELGVPAVLVEWGFATSPRDAALLLVPAARPALVAAAGAGIARAIELTHGP